MATDKPERVATAGEYLLNEARYGVQDIRQKLFEEAWFGRAVTLGPAADIDKSQLGDLQPNIQPSGQQRRDDSEDVPDQRDAPKHRPSFEDVWGTPSHSPETSEHEKGHESPDLER
jgi:hypothetical protein